MYVQVSEECDTMSPCTHTACCLQVPCVVLSYSQQRSIQQGWRKMEGLMDGGVEGERWREGGRIAGGDGEDLD